MLRFALSALALIALAGCANTSKTYLPDGREGHSINCSGTARHWGMCAEAAGSICGARGYDIIARDGEQGAVASVSGNSGFASSTYNRVMLIACKR